VQGRRATIGVAVLAALALALVIGLAARSTGDGGSDAGAPCHAQVNCVGQVANAPLGASALPASAVAVLVALLLAGRVATPPTPSHDRLVAGRLFRPPRTLG
jgi:hypothetical protein